MLETLRRLVHDIGDATDVDEALQLVVHWVRRAMRIDACAIYLLDPSDDHLVLMAALGLNPEAVGQVRLGPGEGVVGLVRERREPVSLERLAKHPKYRHFPITGEARYQAFLGVPIIHYRKVLGALVVLHEAPRKFGNQDEALLLTASAQLAGAIAESVAGKGPSKLFQSARSREPFVQGVPGAPGVAIGTVVMPSPLANLTEVPDRESVDSTLEETAFLQAVLDVQGELRENSERLRTLLPSEALALFDVYSLMVCDDSFVSRTVSRIRSGCWAPAALRDTVADLAASFEQLGDERLRARAEDIRAVGRRLLIHLQAAERVSQQFPERAVLVGDEVSLARIADVPRERLVAVVCLKGSTLSHTAIVARALGVPAVMGLGELTSSCVDGRTVVVDGYQGRVFVEPDARIRAEFERLEREERELDCRLTTLKELPARTPDGADMPLYVNTGLLTDITPSLSVGAQGVGLYRTEFPFMLRETFPSEEEQLETYTQVLKAFSPRPVVMRTLDIGGDKSLPYFPIEEANSLLGWRGIRVSLHHPEIFLTQLKAMLRAHREVGNLRILLPMVGGLEEVKEAKALVRQAAESLRKDPLGLELPPLGVMVEVPAAVFGLDDLATEVEFFSLGTNDLTQYLLAVDRGNPRVAGLYDHLHPAMLRTVDFTIKRARALGKPIGVCGELAGDVAGATLLLGMGVDYLSMAACAVPRVKWAIRAVTQSQAAALAQEAQALTEARAVRVLVETALKDAGVSGLIRAGA